MDRRRGFTLLEAAVSALLLALLSVPIFGLLNSAGRSVKKTDERKEARYLMREVTERIEAADFITLYDAFGIEPDSANRIRTGLVAGSRNPLQISEETLKNLDERGWVVQVTFRFMTREEVGQDGNNPMSTRTGILHLQGGYLTLDLNGPGLPPQGVKRPIYCPLILGRPGLMLAQCPALNQGIQRAMFANIP